jgi:hypothetical protein
MSPSRTRKAVVLASASKDGAILSNAVAVFGIGAVRGSSSRRAVAGLPGCRGGRLFNSPDHVADAGSRRGIAERSGSCAPPPSAACRVWSVILVWVVVALGDLIAIFWPDGICVTTSRCRSR